MSKSNVVIVRVALTQDQIEAFKRYARETTSGMSWRQEVEAAALNGINSVLDIA